MIDSSPRMAPEPPAPVRLGALVRWPRQAIEDWIASGCKPVRQEVRRHAN
jgi:predicted DNA-binding transcriptional regulator AlpA